MNRDLLDQLDINIGNMFGKSTDISTPKQEPTFTAKLTSEPAAGNDETAILQVNIAKIGVTTSQLSAVLDALSSKFSNLTILIDMELAVLIYSIIMPYMSIDQIKGMISKRKLTWVTDHISAINNTAMPWSVITDKDESIESSRSKNISRIKILLKNDSDFSRLLEQDAELFKQYLIDTDSITPASYSQAQEKNDKALEDYLISMLATAQALHDFNRYKHSYIALNNMHSYHYLQQTALPNLPEFLTVEITQTAGIKEPLPTSTEVNQKLHELNMLDKITERRSYLEKYVKHFPGNAYIEAQRSFLACNKQQSLTLASLNDETFLEGKTFDSLFPKNEADALADIVDEITNNNKIKILVEHTTYLGNIKTHLSVKAPLRNKKDKIIGIIGFSREVTDEAEIAKLKALDPEKIVRDFTTQYKHSDDNASQHSNNWMKKIIQDMPGHVLWQDIDGNIICTNDYQAVFLGFKSPDEMIGKPLSQFLTEKHAKASLQHIDEIVKTGESLTAEEIYKTPDGLVAMRSHKTPINDENGKAIGVMIISFDISDSKQLELKLELEKEKLEVANNFKKQFIRNLESDLRVPFTEICNMTTSYVEKEDDWDKKNQLLEISHCANDLLMYCNSLLEFSRNGPSEEKKEPIELKNLIDNISRIGTISTIAQQLQFELEYDKNIPTTVIGDRYRLGRILSNLMSNSAKFTDSGYIKLLVKLESIEADSVTISFTVSDSGIGISQEDQEKIFNRYSTLNYTERRLDSGQGLGLSEVKRFTEDLGGELSIESEENKGTSITVKLNFSLPKEN